MTRAWARWWAVLKNNIKKKLILENSEKTRTHKYTKNDPTKFQLSLGTMCSQTEKTERLLTKNHPEKNVEKKPDG